MQWKYSKDLETVEMSRVAVQYYNIQLANIFTSLAYMIARL